MNTISGSVLVANEFVKDFVSWMGDHQINMDPNAGDFIMKVCMCFSISKVLSKVLLKGLIGESTLK